jgi:hypothetical protein
MVTSLMPRPRRPSRPWRTMSRRLAVMAKSVLVAVFVPVLTSPAAVAQEVTVDPSWENAPWVPQVQKILNVTAQMGLACCVLSLLVGGAAMGLGKVAGSYQAGHRGLQLILGGGGGSLVIVSAASIISWLIGADGPTA